MSQQKDVIENESMGLCLSRCLLFRRKLIYIGYRLPSKVASRREIESRGEARILP